MSAEIDNPSEHVIFGTSGHRGTSLQCSFTESHILAIAQSICDYRKKEGINGPLFLGKDTHALSSPAEATVIQVFAANNIKAEAGSPIETAIGIIIAIIPFNWSGSPCTFKATCNCINSFTRLI